MSSKIIAGTTSGTALNMSADTSGILEIQTGSGPTTAITVNASQNVGIGVTPSAWSTLQALEFVNGIYLASNISGAPDLYLGCNNYYNGSNFIYKTTAAATRYEQSVGSHIWFTAPSGTAGTAITSSQQMTLDQAGKWYLNTTSSNYNTCANLDFTGFGNGFDTKWTGTGSIYHLLCTNGNGLVGGVQTSGSSTAFLTSSDYRLKENVAPMTGALDKVSALKPVTYKWKVDGSDGQGFIAHELQAIVPDCVIGEKDAVNEDGTIKPQSIDTSFLVATLTAAIKEQQALITTLQEQVTALQAKVGV